MRHSTPAGRAARWAFLLPLAAALAGSSACAARTAETVQTAVAGPAAAAAPASAPTPAAVPATASAPSTDAPAPAPLVGHVTRGDLEGYVTWTDLRAQDYAPDPAAVKTIAERSRDVTVLAIVATWCRDSKREVPRFFKVADQAGLVLDRVTLVSVDRTKKDAEGLTEKHAITRVPTFVFFRGGRELGRVTERAATTLENDIALIVSK